MLQLKAKKQNSIFLQHPQNVFAENQVGKFCPVSEGCRGGIYPGPGLTKTPSSAGRGRDQSWCNPRSVPEGTTDGPGTAIKTKARLDAHPGELFQP